MTERQNQSEQAPSEATQQPKEVPTQGTARPATLSDENVQSDGSGKHGRPTDDSDPGHS